MPGNSELSERELEILRLVATGASNKEIALQLHISTNTVKVHLRNIFAKVGAESRTEAAMYAVNAGLVPASTGVADEKQASAGGEKPAIDDIGNYAQPPNLELYEEGNPNKVARRSLESWVWGVIVLLLIIGAVVGFWFLRLPDQESTQQELSDAPQQARWSELPGMPSARAGLAVATLDGQIFAIAGEGPNGITDVVERYDPISLMWIRLTPKPTAVRDVQAAVIGGKVYLPGGLLPSGEKTNVLEIYDPGNNSWSSGTALPLPISGYALAVFEGRLYIFGGFNENEILKSVFVYDPGTDAWQQNGDMDKPRGFSAAVASGEKIFLLGGTDGNNALADVDVYLPSLDNTNTRAWSSGKDLPSGRYAMGVASIADFIQLFGGIGAGENAQLIYQYSPVTEEWQEIGSLGNGTWSHLGVVPLGPLVYLVGGSVDDQPSNGLYAFQAIYTINFPMITR